MEIEKERAGQYLSRLIFNHSSNFTLETLLTLPQTIRAVVIDFRSAESLVNISHVNVLAKLVSTKIS
jgi:hypothetical protein